MSHHHLNFFPWEIHEKRQKSCSVGAQCRNKDAPSPRTTSPRSFPTTPLGGPLLCFIGRVQTATDFKSPKGIFIAQKLKFQRSFQITCCVKFDFMNRLQLHVFCHHLFIISRTIQQCCMFHFRSCNVRFSSTYLSFQWWKRCGIASDPILATFKTSLNVISSDVSASVQSRECPWQSDGGWAGCHNLQFQWFAWRTYM